MSMDWLVILLMAVGFVVFVGEPLLRGTTAHRLVNGGRPEVEQLSLQKETLYTAIRDLDFDFQTGKVDAGDYGELRHQLETEAVQILRSLDAVDPLVMLDHEIERQILALRQQQGADTHPPSQGVCLACDTALQGKENFCPFCGQALRPT